MKPVLPAACLLLLSAASVSAADLATAPQLPVIASAQEFDWTGFYIGAHVGYGWGHLGRPEASGGKADGVLGGGQIGANWQWNQIVLGAEADISGIDISGETSTPGGVTVLSSDMNYFGTVRGRLGFAYDRFLVYGTGGFAYAGFDQTFQVLGVRASTDGTQTGWTAGGGVEVGIDAHWSVRAEYLHADLGDKRYHFGGSRPLKVSYDQDLVRAGVNYKF